MASTDTVFSGSVPELYTQYMGPIFFEPYAQDIAHRLTGMSSGDILETACGTGIVTRSLCRALPEAVAITATDLNQPMLDYAKTLPGGERVRWQQADAQALPFPDGVFDAVVCTFGVMFFPDKARGYREALRVLRPGGRFIFSVWDRLETVGLFMETHTAVAALYPRDPPGFFPRTPFSYHDIAAIQADLTRSGFADAEIETVGLACRAASARDVAIGAVRGSPLSMEILARDPAGLDAAVKVTAEAIAARYGAGPVEARMQAHVVTVQRPPA
jgi:SAM-dependent methyltransferase